MKTAVLNVFVCVLLLVCFNSNSFCSSAQETVTVSELTSETNVVIVKQQNNSATVVQITVQEEKPVREEKAKEEKSLSQALNPLDIFFPNLEGKSIYLAVSNFIVRILSRPFS